MTLIRHPGLRTNDPSLPSGIYSAATMTFAALPNRRRWIEGGAGFLGRGNWYDRMSGEACPLTGSLIEGDPLSSRKGTLFDGTQSVNLGNVFPAAADYNVFVVYRRGPTIAGGGGSGGGMGLLSSAAASGASYRSHRIASSNGRPAVTHAGDLQYVGKVDHALGSLSRLHFGWVEAPAKAVAVLYNDAPEADPTVSAVTSTPDVTAWLGIVGNLGPTFNFVGTIYHLSIFGTLTAAQQTAARTYLAEQYSA